MMTASSTKAFQWRALTSVLIAGAFLLLAISGVLLFLSPPGRIANWTDWRLLGLTKGEWIALHVAFSALFLVTTVVHLFFNWRPMLNYFRDRVSRQLGWRWEWAVALGICTFVFLGARHNLPPFAQLMAWNEDLKQGWDDPNSRAPIPHAELLTLEALATQTGLDLEQATHRLQQAGARGFDAQTQLKAIASSLERPAQEVYDILIQDAGPSQSAHGTGLGWKTLSAYCTEQGLSLNEAQAALGEQGWQADPSETLKEIADRNHLDRPYRLVQTLRSLAPDSATTTP